MMLKAWFELFLVPSGRGLGMVTKELGPGVLGVRGGCTFSMPAHMRASTNVDP